MLGDAELVAFAASTDLDRTRAFYEHALGLELVEQTSFACVFRAPDATLRVTLVERLARARYTVLGWRVQDIRATARELVDRGVELLRYDGLTQDELGIWRSPGGAQVAWFSDPDGNVLSVTED